MAQGVDGYLTSASNTADPDASWADHVLELVQAGLWLALLLVSIAANLTVVVSVTRNAHLHSGYFALQVGVSALHVLLFASSFAEAGARVVQKRGLLQAWRDEAAQADNVLDSMTDLNDCLLALVMYLLCVMTVDLCISLSRKYEFRIYCQSVWRVALAISGLALSVVLATLLILIRWTDILDTGHPIDDETMPALLRVCLKLGLVCSLPLLVMVCTATANAVSHRLSSRVKPVSQQVALKLDAMQAWTVWLVLMVKMAQLIVHFAIRSKAYVTEPATTQEALFYSDCGLQLASAVLLTMIALNAAITVSACRLAQQHCPS